MQHLSSSSEYRRLADGGIDYAYYREAADRERLDTQRRVFAAIFRGAKWALSHTRLGPSITNLSQHVPGRATA